MSEYSYVCSSLELERNSTSPETSLNPLSARVDGGDGAQRCRAGDAAGGAFRLDNRTLLDSPRYRATVRDFGDGLAEVGWSFVCAPPGSKAGRGESESREENDQRAIRRSRSRLRQLVLASNATHLLTLTYRANVTAFDDASAHLSKFARMVKRKYPGWRYIAVAEKQERGAWHWHIAVCGWQDVGFLRATWRAIVGEGNIDVKPPRGTGSAQRLGLIRYLSKYLAKTFSDGDRRLNQHRFRASHDITVPEEQVTLTARTHEAACALALSLLNNIAGRVGFHWVNDDGSAGWACSWGDPPAAATR